jgi:hypothetical protein
MVPSSVDQMVVQMVDEMAGLMDEKLVASMVA